MKVIQITGRSNTGKTTFIRNLVPVLNKTGKVAVIKHLADHEYHLEEEKDTTVFFHAGAEISAGIDPLKAVVILRDNSLDTMLMFLKGRGMDFVIIEGFKQCSFKKIVIGSLEAEGCILRNPTVHEVIASIGRFDTY
jgi:molybdopterin-guanine dinucleotide biosynthesis protein MobB